MERVAAMATVSQASSLLAVTGSGAKQQKVNAQSLGSCRVLSGGEKLVRVVSGARMVSTGTSGRENGVVRVVSKQAAVSTPTKESAVEKEVYDCVVVGAGISGLCTAQALGTRYSRGFACNAVSVFVPARSNACLLIPWSVLQKFRLFSRCHEPTNAISSL